MSFSTLKYLLEVDFTNKVKIDPNAVAQDVKSSTGQSKKFDDMTLSEKLLHLNKMYLAGQKLLRHVNTQKETQHVNNETGETTTHFDDAEKMKIRMRVLTGFKQLKAITVSVLRQFEAEEAQLQSQVKQNGPH